MAGSKSNYLEQAIQNHVLGATAYTAPGTVYAALYTVAPSDTGGGTECTGGSYARVAITNNTTNWPAASGSSVKSNGTAINFPTATASWGTAVAMALLDASSGGNYLLWADLATSKAIGIGDQPFFGVGDLTWTED